MATLLKNIENNEILILKNKYPWTNQWNLYRRNNLRYKYDNLI